MPPRRFSSQSFPAVASPTAGSFHLACTVGRLIEARIVALPSVESVNDLVSAFKRLEAKVPGQHLTCSDYRRATLFSPPVAEELAALMQHANQRLLRSAIVLPSGNATLTLQIERMVREGNNPARRTFRDVEQALAWLAPVLDASEGARASEFLRETG